jgi:hypothetical protein
MATDTAHPPPSGNPDYDRWMTRLHKRVKESAPLISPAFTTPNIGAATAASLAATGAVAGASVAATGAVTGATVTATGAVAGASVAATGAVTGATVTATGLVKSSSASAGMGYATGAGGAVTQLSNKTFAVTLNTVCGQVTMNAAALAAGAKVSFTVTNSACAATDVVVVSVASGGTANAYRAAVTAVAAGSFVITVENITAGSLSESPVVNFAIVKAVAA